MIKGGIADGDWSNDQDITNTKYTSVITSGNDMFSTHSVSRGGNCEMSINLSQLYSNFQGDITVPTASKENQGNLKIQIYGDDTLLWESVNITGNSRDVHFDINVTDVRQLVIESITDEVNPGPSVAIINDVINVCF